ncbi:MAG: pitrilysin family protein [Proteobacteria bacterium]|nr:pitrilysin family protein [Pseudomonadota bacterium]
MRYFLALCLFLCSSLLVAEETKQTESNSIKIVPQKATLSSGIRLIVFKNPILPSVTVWTGYDVGTADDPVDLVGLSHMLEHMMFKGTPTYPEGAIDSVINQLGGELNAFTNFDYTVYTFSAPAQYLEKIFDIEADRMSNLNFSKESFLAEQKVVIEERQMRIGNHPLRTASEVCRRAQFIAHPYGVYPIGYEGHIRSYTYEALMAHYKKYYVPNNATVIVVGPFDLAYVLPIFEKKFGTIPSKPSPVRKRMAEPSREGLTTTVEQENPRAENIYIEIFYKAPTLVKKPEDFQKMQVMLSALFGSESRALYKEMVKEKRLALDVSGSYACGKDDMGFSFRLQLSPDMDVDAAEAFLFEQLQLILQNGLNENDFKAAKQEKLNEFAFAMDGEDFLVSMAESIIEGFSVEDISRYEQLVSDVTIEQTREMLELVLSNPPVLIARNYPKRKMPSRNYHKIGQKIEKKENEKKSFGFSTKKTDKHAKKAKSEKVE